MGGIIIKVNIKTQYKASANRHWKKLDKLSKSASTDTIENYFLKDTERVSKYSIALKELYVDFSKNLISDEIFRELNYLAATSPLLERRDSMFKGELINLSECRSVLHTALRDPAFQDKNISEQIATQLDKVTKIAGQVRSGEWIGSQGQIINNIVNIGIGGSDIGPKMACEALKEFAHPRLKLYFISNLDDEPIRSLLNRLDPRSTLFVISSKTFTTQETIINTQVAVDWIEEKLGITDPLNSPHFVAITASPKLAIKHGVAPDQILEFWEWVGGRFSLWSSAGFAICLCIGPDNFRRFLAGAKKADEHFQHTPLKENLPVQLALISIWYNNFLHVQSNAIVPYCERLSHLPSFLQQLEMESNGKRVDIDGLPIDYDSASVTWGQTGTNAQHAFFQMLHQGTCYVPVDFIGIAKDSLSEAKQHRMLLANMLAQGAALMSGSHHDDSFRDYPGNRPSTTFILDELTPETLGLFISVHEHRVFCEGAIWNINSFDQWGVELGKQLTLELLEKGVTPTFDASTSSLFKRLNTTVD